VVTAGSCHRNIDYGLVERTRASRTQFRAIKVNRWVPGFHTVFISLLPSALSQYHKLRSIFHPQTLAHSVPHPPLNFTITSRKTFPRSLLGVLFSRLLRHSHYTFHKTILITSTFPDTIPDTSIPYKTTLKPCPSFFRGNITKFDLFYKHQRAETLLVITSPPLSSPYLAFSRPNQTTNSKRAFPILPSVRTITLI